MIFLNSKDYSIYGRICSKGRHISPLKSTNILPLIIFWYNTENYVTENKKKKNWLVILNFRKGFPYFRPHMPQRPTYLPPHINKYLTFDNIFDIILKNMKKKTRKYHFISDLKMLQIIPLFQAISASKADIFIPSHQKISYLWQPFWYKK